MRCLLPIFVFGALPFLAGCAVVPMFSDYDSKEVDQSMKQLEEDRMMRLRESKTVNDAEYDAFNKKTRGAGSATGIPKPTIEQLQQQVEADKKALQ